MAVPSWLSLTFTIADFIVQRVDRIGPVELEASDDQPPERAQAVMDADVQPPDMDTSLDEAPPAEVDSPQNDSSDSFGFQAARNGGTTDPDEGNKDGEIPEPDDGDEDDDPEPQSASVQCSFRAMRPSDAPTRYEVEQTRDGTGEDCV